MDELSEEERMVSRARKVQDFVPTLLSAENLRPYLKIRPISETVRGFKEIIEGIHDEIPRPS